MFQFRGDIREEFLAVLRPNNLRNVLREPHGNSLGWHFVAYEIRHKCAPLRPIERGNLIESDSVHADIETLARSTIGPRVDLRKRGEFS